MYLFTIITTSDPYLKTVDGQIKTFQNIAWTLEQPTVIYGNRYFSLDTIRKMARVFSKTYNIELCIQDSFMSKGEVFRHISEKNILIMYDMFDERPEH